MSPPGPPRSPAPSYAPRGEEEASPGTRDGTARGDPGLARRRGTRAGPVNSPAAVAPAAPGTPPSPPAAPPARPLTLPTPRSLPEEAEPGIAESPSRRMFESGNWEPYGIAEPDTQHDPRVMAFGTSDCSVRDPAALRFWGSGPGSPLPGPRD